VAMDASTTMCLSACMSPATTQADTTRELTPPRTQSTLKISTEKISKAVIVAHTSQLGLRNLSSMIPALTSTSLLQANRSIWDMESEVTFVLKTPMCSSGNRSELSLQISFQLLLKSVLPGEKAEFMWLSISFALDSKPTLAWTKKVALTSTLVSMTNRLTGG
jgi:hypothetical protein